MDQVKNPFSPGAGTRPPELAGRESIIEDALINIKRANIGNNCRPQMYLGLRGVGKTVLLNKIESLAEENGHIATFIEADEKIDLKKVLNKEIQQVLKKLSTVELVKQEVARGWAALKSFLSNFEMSVGDISVSVEPEVGIADSGRFESDLSQLFLIIGQLAQKAQKPWTLLIDEIQYLNREDLSALIVALHKCNQKSVPILFFGAGLPSMAAMSGDAKSYAERLFSYPPIGKLSERDANAAIEVPINQLGEKISSAALKLIYERTQGYPYFLQEWGAKVWHYSTEGKEIDRQDVENATNSILKNLDEGFFKVRIDRLTNAEKDFVIAMSTLHGEMYKISDIASQLNKESKNLSGVRDKIIKKGMIYSPSYGELAFTVPLFADYLRRNSKIWEIKDGA